MPSEVLTDQLRVSVGGPRRVRGVRRMSARERAFALARVRRLAAAVRRAGRHRRAPGCPRAHGRSRAGARGRARALRAHVEAIGLLGEREWRELLGELVAGGARNEASLRTKLGGRPLETAFPGQPSR